MFIVFFILSGILGYCVLRFFDTRKTLQGTSLIAISLMLGVTVIGYGILGASLATGNMIWATGLVFCTLFGLAILFRRSLRQTISDIGQQMRGNESFPWFERVMVAVALFLFFLVSMQSMLWDNTGVPYSILKGWGDGAYHLSMVQRFLHANPFSLDQPILSGRTLTYPFFVNFLTALLVRLGMPFSWAWHAPTFIFGWGMLVCGWMWAREFFNKRILSYLFVFVLVCGAGLGFLWLAKNVALDVGRIGIGAAIEKDIVNTVFEYSHLDIRTGGKPLGGGYPANIVWVVPLISFFSHQRSFMLGAGIGFLLLYGLWRYWYARDCRWSRWLVLFSFLPLIHLHTFIALVIFIGSWLAARIARTREFFTKKIFVWGIVAFLLTIPSVIWLGHGVVRDAAGSSFFLRPWFGWAMCTHAQSWLWCDPGVADTTNNVLWFWAKNFGFIWIGWVAAMLFFMTRGKGNERIRDIILPSTLLFILPNIVLFQPWEFDNNKIFFWWWAAAGILSLGLSDMEFEKFSRRKIILFVFLVLFCAFAVLSGVFDIAQRARHGFVIKSGEKNFSYYGGYGIAIANMTEDRTGSEDIILTSRSPNTPVALIAGRRLYLGYTGWLWTQGKRKIIEDRQRAIKAFLETGEIGPLCDEGVRYWVVDDQFFRDYPVTVSQTVWQRTELMDAVHEGKLTTELRKLDCGTR